MDDLKYQCMFCGGAIQPESGVCAVILVTNWAGPQDEQVEQQFFCHADCFRRHAHPSVPLYVLDAQTTPQREAGPETGAKP